MAFIGERPVACLGWGSAAWAVKSRDAFIGWDKQTKKNNFHKFTIDNIVKKLPDINEKIAAILSRMAGIVVLLKRAFSFIVKITTLFRKYLQETNAETKAKLELLLRPPRVPAFITKLIQRE